MPIFIGKFLIKKYLIDTQQFAVNVEKLKDKFRVKTHSYFILFNN